MAVVLHTPNKSAFVLCIAFLALLLSACDELVFTQGEMEAKRKYEAVKRGHSRQAVADALGTPAFELVLDKKRMKYRYVDATGKQAELDGSKGSPPDAPPELRFLPKGLSASRVLVYSAGTVFGYVALTDQDVVDSVTVVVS